MHRLIFWICIGALMFPREPALSQTPPKLVLSLEACENLAVQNNPLLKEAQLSVEQAQIKQSQAANASILPKFELSNVWGAIPRARAVYTETGVLTSPDTSTSFSDLRVFTETEISMIQPLYTFGKLSSLRQAAEYGVQASKAGFEKREAEIRLLTRKLYWGILLGQELLEVIDDARKEIGKAEDKLNEKLDEGDEDVSQNDLFKLQIFRYEINKKYREARRGLQFARASLLATMGQDERVDFQPEEQYLDPAPVAIDSLPIYLNLAMQRRPEVQQLRAGLGARRALVGVSQSEYYPQIFLAGSIKYNYAQDRDDPRNPWVYNPTNFFRPAMVVGLKMNLNFAQTRNKVRLAQNEYQKLADQEHLLLTKIQLDVQKKYLELLAAQENLRESRRALKASGNWLRSVSMSFDLGLAEVKELIDAYKANSSMKGEHLRNIFTYNVLIAELSKEIGYDLFSQKMTQE